MTNVLVVDDDISTRSLLKILLELEGFQVILPSIDLTEIYSSLSYNGPVIALIDYNLPMITGIEVLKYIRNHPHLKNTFVLMTSGMDVREVCLSQGADGFLMKPYMPSELIAWLKQHSGTESNRSSLG